ncbi:MAG: hypothetical protein WC683_15730 [bacterium]
MRCDLLVTGILMVGAGCYVFFVMHWQFISIFPLTQAGGMFLIIAGILVGLAGAVSRDVPKKENYTTNLPVDLIVRRNTSDYISEVLYSIVFHRNIWSVRPR